MEHMVTVKLVYLDKITTLPRAWQFYRMESLHSLGHHKTAAMLVEVIRKTLYEQYTASCVRNWTYLAKILAPVFNYI
jgi:hypothetical protein